MLLINTHLVVDKMAIWQTAVWGSATYIEYWKNELGTGWLWSKDTIQLNRFNRIVCEIIVQIIDYNNFNVSKWRKKKLYAGV